MKMLVVSDLHLDAATMGVPRLPELERSLDQAVHHAADAKVDEFVFLGDLADPDIGSGALVRALDVLVRVVMKLRCAYGISSKLLVGNHDVIEDGSGDTTLSPLRGIEGVTVLDHPTSWVKGDLFFVALPYTATSHGYDVRDFLAKHLTDQPTVVLSHLAVEGIQPGEETKEMPRGREVLLPLDMLENPKHLVLQGHYHKGQTFVSPGGAQVHVVGSLARLTFGEEGNEPGYLIVEWR